MIIITSPTKIMKPNNEVEPNGLPQFLEQSKKILSVLQSFTMEDLKSNMKVNEKIAKENYERFQKMSFDQHGSSAIFTYQGLQFQSMNIDRSKHILYLQRHLRILSGFYGVLRPLDSIYPYRLEMQSMIPVCDAPHIYGFWSGMLAEALLEEAKQHKESYILNLSSKEYERSVLPYVPKESVITLVFMIRKQGKLKTESTQAKKARGAMIHYLADNEVETLEEVKNFQADGYHFDKSLSNQQQYVFIREEAHEVCNQ